MTNIWWSSAPGMSPSELYSLMRQSDKFRVVVITFICSRSGQDKQVQNGFILIFKDTIYILLWNGEVLKVTGSLLEDPAVSNEELDLERVFKKEDDKDDEDFKGFCVYGKKMALFGYNGICVVNIKVRRKSVHKTIRVVNNTIVAPLSTRLVAPVVNWFYKRM